MSVWKKEGISYTSMAEVPERWIDANVDWSVITEIEILELDEIALEKGYRDYVTLVTGRLRDGEIMILVFYQGMKKQK